MKKKTSETIKKAAYWGTGLFLLYSLIKSFVPEITLAKIGEIKIPEERENEFKEFEPKILGLNQACYSENSDFFDILIQILFGNDLEGLSEEELKNLEIALELSKSEKSLGPLYYVLVFKLSLFTSEDFYLISDIVCVLEPSLNGVVSIHASAQQTNEGPPIEVIKIGKKAYSFRNTDQDWGYPFTVYLTEGQQEEVTALFDAIFELDLAAYITWEDPTFGLMEDIVQQLLEREIKISNESDTEPAQEQDLLLDRIRAFREENQ